jgi:hypothetical protein
MENNEHNRYQIMNALEDESESCLSDEPKVQLNELEENEQILRFEEDLASYYLDKMAIIL